MRIFKFMAATAIFSWLGFLLLAALANYAHGQPVGSLNEQVGWEEFNTGNESSPNSWGQMTLQFTDDTMSWSPFGSGPLNMRVRVAKSRTQPDGCAMIVVWVEAMDKSLPGAMERREGSAYTCPGEAI